MKAKKSNKKAPQTGFINERKGKRHPAHSESLFRISKSLKDQVTDTRFPVGRAIMIVSEAIESEAKRLRSVVR